MSARSSSTRAASCRCDLRHAINGEHGNAFHPMNAPTLVALLHGPDHTGIVARTAGWIFARQGNILHADQHRDMEAGEFFQRIEWAPAGVDLAQEAAEFRN